MERLTKRQGRKTYLTDDACNLCGYAEKRSSTFCENIGCASAKDRTCPYLQVIDRLAAYEDTGLTPLQITDMIDKIRFYRKSVKNTAAVLDFLHNITEG